jgi:hypothetical protein
MQENQYSIIILQFVWDCVSFVYNRDVAKLRSATSRRIVAADFIRLTCCAELRTSSGFAKFLHLKQSSGGELRKSAATLWARLRDDTYMTTDSNILKELLKLTCIKYPLFADYCFNLDKGLRKNALKCLDSFLDNTKNWEYLTKENFCKTIFGVSHTTNNDIEFILTTNLADKLIKPTLLEMTTLEPNNFLAFKWCEQYFRDTTFIKKAHELNPTDN